MQVLADWSMVEGVCHHDAESLANGGVLCIGIITKSLMYVDRKSGYLHSFISTKFFWN